MTTAATTGYDVSLRYVLEDRTGPGLKQMGQDLRMANQSARELHGSLGALSSLGGMATGLAGMFGLHEAKKAFIDFNSEMEQSKTTIAGMLQMNIGGEWADNVARATDAVQQLQKESITSTATTKEMVDMLTMVIQPLSRTGESMEQMTKQTSSLVVLSKAMGFAPQIAAIEFSEAMNGTLNARNRFMNAILGTPEMGYGGEEGRRRWNALAEQKKGKEVDRATLGKAAMEMKEAQAHTFAGELSTLIDKKEIGLGKAGLAIFKEITAEIHNWNVWLAANDDKVETFVKTLSNGLREAFSVMRSLGSYLVDNRGWLLEVAKLWGGLKIAGGLGGIVGGVGGLFGGLRADAAALGGAITGSKGGVVPALGGMAVGLASTTANVVALGVAAWNAGKLIGDYWGESMVQKKVDATKGEVTGPLIAKEVTELRGMLRAGPEAMQLQAAKDRQRLLLKTMERQGLVGSNGVDTEAVARMLKTSQELKTEFGKALGTEYTVKNLFGQSVGTDVEHNPDTLAQGLAKFLDPMISDLRDAMKKGPPPITPAAVSSEKPKVNVTINRIEVVSDDPDRFITNLAQAARDAVKNPGQAQRVWREGG